MPDHGLARLLLAAFAVIVATASLPALPLAQVVEAVPQAAGVEAPAPGVPAADDLTLREVDGAGDPLPQDLSPVSMFLNADGVVKSVIASLAAASVASWAIFLGKAFELGGRRRRWGAFRQRLARAGTLDEAVELTGRRRDSAGRLVRAAADEVELSRGLPAEGVKERVALRFERIQAGAGRDMARGTGILAQVGALSPFVGLFGTVWGIMNAFIGISRASTTNLAVVAPGIAEALFATGIGLAAAIPAVLFYNLFARMIAANKAVIADIAAETLGLVSRDLDRAAQRSPFRLSVAAE